MGLPAMCEAALASASSPFLAVARSVRNQQLQGITRAEEMEVPAGDKARLGAVLEFINWSIWRSQTEQFVKDSFGNGTLLDQRGSTLSFRIFTSEEAKLGSLFGKVESGKK